MLAPPSASRSGFWPGMRAGVVIFGVLCSLLSARSILTSFRLTAPVGDSCSQGLSKNAVWLTEVLQSWSRSCDPPGLVAAKCHLVAALIDGDTVTYARAVAGAPASASLLSADDVAVRRLYEIASITKVFTALVLCRLSASPGSKITLNTTIGDVFPALASRAAQMRDRRILQVTLEQLAAHTGGMPRMPSGLHGTDFNIFSNFDDDDLLAECMNLELAPHYGSFYYSNFGFGLLGRLMEMATGASLAALISMYITGPLGMSDTIAAAGTPDLLPLSSSDWAQRVIPGHSENGALTWRNTSYGVLQGNGFLESSLVDMATFARTMLKGFGLLEYTTGTGSKEDNMEARELSAAFAEAFKMRAPSEARQHSAIGLGVQWYVSRGAAVSWKDGDTEGYSSLIAADASTGRAVVVLDNCAGCAHDVTRQISGSITQRAGKLLVRGPPSSRGPLSSHILSPQQLEPLQGCYLNAAGRVAHVRGNMLVDDMGKHWRMLPAALPLFPLVAAATTAATFVLQPDSLDHDISSDAVNIFDMLRPQMARFFFCPDTASVYTLVMEAGGVDVAFSATSCSHVHDQAAGLRATSASDPLDGI